MRWGSFFVTHLSRDVVALGRLSPRVNRALRVEVEPARCLRHRIPYLGHRVGSTFWQNNPLSRYADVIKSAELGAQAP